MTEYYPDRIRWKQISPAVTYKSITDLTATDTKDAIIFEDIQYDFSTTTGYVEANYTFVKLRMSTFNYFAESDIFRVLARADNLKNGINYDVIEFYVNDPPKTKVFYSNSSQHFHNYTMASVLWFDTVNNTSTATLNGWYDAVDDTTQ